MYNNKLKSWESGKYTQAKLAWCREPENKENSEAMFILADTLLQQAAKGKETSEAIYLMEASAKAGYVQAALAMGQLFQYGWGVSHSTKNAIEWYKKASQLGNLEAAAFLKKLKRQKRLRFLAAIGSSALFLTIICVFVLSLSSGLVQGVIVHDDTELIETVDLAEFTDALNDLVAKYDNELVISGQCGSNRLMLRFEGEGIDLSDFPAAVVIEGDNNFLIVQFDSEEETKKCLETLKNTKGINFVEEDNYDIGTNEVISDSDLSSSGVPYVSPYTGFTYYSWGVEYMGLDRLADWIMTQQTNTVTVAVLDTGSEPCQENAHLYLDGVDVVDSGNSNGWNDSDGHGTHVAGTIIDCTWGLDVKIMPVRVLAPGGSPSSIVIAGIQYAISSGVDVINMSLGSPCSESNIGETCGSAKDYYIQEAVNNGIVVVVAAGNGDENGNPANTNQHCPAHNDAAIVVAACDSNDNLASFSNYGDAVDVCAPGVDVVSYYPGGTLKSLNGTSMATPHVSSLVVMLKMLMPDKTPVQLEKYISDYCVDMVDTAAYGAGIPWAAYFAGN